MKIDIFSHILPIKYKEALIKKVPDAYKAIQVNLESVPGLSSLEVRFKVMDKFNGLAQVLTMHPLVERVAQGKDAIELARIGNDALAELVEKHPSRFVAAIGNLPMIDIDASLDEIDRTINKLHFHGVQIGTDINGKPLDSTEFMPLFKKMEAYNLPILLHPVRPNRFTDYISEANSKYDIFCVFGWPYDTSAAMTRLVFSHVLEKYPNLKIITHHCGAMIPYFAQRISCIYDLLRTSRKYEYIQNLRKSPIENFKMFYADTAIQGNTPALMCAYNFFGAEHLLFGTDMPFDSQNGSLVIGETIESIEQMDIPGSDKQKIFEDNAKKILNLPVK